MRQAILTFVVAAILGTTIFVYADYTHQETLFVANSQPAAPMIEKSKPKPKSVRLHSGQPVVKGGIHNLPQLAAAMSNPEIVENFKGIDILQMHPIILDHSVLAWVSYYVPNHGIFWTVSPVLLRKGEVVLFDGSSYLRAQCGNRIAFAPGLRVAPELEAIPNTLETPISSVYTINQIYPPVTPIAPYYPPTAPPIYTPFLPTPISKAANPFPSIKTSLLIFGLVLLLRYLLKTVNGKFVQKVFDKLI